MSDFEKRYGPWAVVAGASEGLGAEFAMQIAARGVQPVVVARREAPLRELATEIERRHGVETRSVVADLALPETSHALANACQGLEVGLLVYNAALASKGPFLDRPLAEHRAGLEINCIRPLELVHHFGTPMQTRGRGGILLMSSLASLQGSPNIAHYGATKAWNRIFAEGLWGELRDRGVDVEACCAGATSTPGYLEERGGEGDDALVPLMEPADVAREALDALGRQPSMVPGRSNRWASFFMQRFLPRRSAILLMKRASARVGVE